MGNNNSGKIKNNPNNRFNPITKRWEKNTLTNHVHVDNVGDIQSEYMYNTVFQALNNIDWDNKKYQTENIFTHGYYPPEDGGGYQVYENTSTETYGDENALLNAEELTAALHDIPGIVVGDVDRKDLVEHNEQLYSGEKYCIREDATVDGYSVCNVETNYLYQHIQCGDSRGNTLVVSIVNKKEEYHDKSEDDIGFFTVTDTSRYSTEGVILHDGTTHKFINIDDHDELAHNIVRFINDGAIGDKSDADSTKKKSRGFLSRLFG